MKLLVIDSTQNFYSIAIFVDGNIFYNEFENRGCISKDLILNIKSMMENMNISLNEIDFFVVNPGPGSFTGIRVAIAAMQSFELIANKPLYGISMFESIAICNRESIFLHGKVKIVIKSDKFNVYVQNFNSKLEPISLVSRICTDKIIENVNDEKIKIFTNDNNLISGDLVFANAKVMAEAFIYHMHNNKKFDSAKPIYIY